ncbi:hypothetical protein [Bordetella sp. LUAb4]|uniref:hypothetical protein n=1 Tax=Bordetella sp. LUAb4 TaxID=2843195 RepID=UPI001E5DCB0A|nr:hypothetical protein [Bordetella sp. LUAb4]
MTNSIAATYAIELFKLAPPHEGEAGARPRIKVSKNIARRATEFINARERLARRFDAVLAAAKNPPSASGNDHGRGLLAAADGMTMAWEKLTQCVGKGPTDGGLTKEMLPSWDGLSPGYWELEHLIEKQDAHANTSDSRIGADVREQTQTESRQRIAQLGAPAAASMPGPWQRLRRIARTPLMVIKKCIRALRRAFSIPATPRAAPMAAQTADAPRTREEALAALRQGKPVSPGPTRMRSRQVSEESLRFEEELQQVQVQARSSGTAWLPRAQGLAFDSGAPARVRSEVLLLIARAHFDEALIEDQRRADEIAAGRDEDALLHIENANRKTTQAAQSLVQLLRVDPAFRLELPHPMRPLLDLVRAAHADLRITRYGMWNETVFEAAAAAAVA